MGYHLKNTKILFLLLLCPILTHAQTGINTRTPDENSVLDIVSNNKGVLLPRLNGTQVGNLTNITGLPQGMLVYNTDVGCIQIYTGTVFECLVIEPQVDTTQDAWVDDKTNGLVKLGTESDGDARTPGTDFVIKDNGNVGIGTSDPARALEVNGDTRLKGKLYDAANNTPETVGQVLSSNSAGLTAWVSSPALKSIVWGVLNSSSTDFTISGDDYTGSYIDLSPGKWMVSIYLILARTGGVTVGSGQGYWIKSTFSDSSTSSTSSSDIIGARIVSGPLNGYNKWGVLTGFFIIENTTTAPTKRYYFWKKAGNSYGEDNANNDTDSDNDNTSGSDQIANFAGSGWGENKIMAIPVN